MTFQEQAIQKTIDKLIDDIQTTNAELTKVLYSIETKIDMLKPNDYERVEKAIRAMKELNYALGLINSIKF